MPALTPLRVRLRSPTDRLLALLEVDTLTRELGQEKAAARLGVSVRTLRRILREERQRATREGAP